MPTWMPPVDLVSEKDVVFPTVPQKACPPGTGTASVSSLRGGSPERWPLPHRYKKMGTMHFPRHLQYKSMGITVKMAAAMWLQEIVCHALS